MPTAMIAGVLCDVLLIIQPKPSVGMMFWLTREDRKVVIFQCVMMINGSVRA